MDAATIDKLSKAIMDDLRPIVAAEVSRQMNDFLASHRRNFEYAVDTAIYKAITDKVDRVINVQVTVKRNDNG